MSPPLSSPLSPGLHAHPGSVAAARVGLTPLVWFGLVALLTAACLLPAVLNGTPPVFTDTQGYLDNMAQFRPSHMRAFGYGAWLRATGGMASLWLPAFAQALLSAWLALRFVALEAAGWPPRWRTGLAVAAVALLLAGPLPWLASWLMPDLFVGLITLALLILGLHWPRLGWPERGALMLFLAGAASIHLTHPPLLFGLALACGALALLARPVRAAARRLALVALLAAALGAGGLVAANAITYKTATISLGSPVFLFARLLEDGDVPAVLAPYCAAGAPWVSCRFLDRLHVGADAFLWDANSPIREMGWFEHFWPEAMELNPLILRQLWPQWLAGVAQRTLAQMVTFSLGDGFDAAGPHMLAEDMPRFGLGWVVPLMTGSRQYTNGLLPYVPVALADALGAAGLLAVLAFGAWGLVRRRPALWWPAALFLLLWLGNAAVIAMAAPVHDRYGTRLVWVAPLLALSLMMRGRRVAPARLGPAQLGPATAAPAAAPPPAATTASPPAAAGAGTGWN